MAVKKKGEKKDENASVEQKKDSMFEGSHEEDGKVKIEDANVEVEDVTESEPAMTVADVEALLKRQEERLSNKFNAELQRAKLSNAKAELDDDAAYIQDLEDDWMDTPAVFFAYSINYSIFGDNKRGLSSVPPQGPVKFKPIIRSKRQTRRGEEVISVSSVKVHSRSVANWLRNHSKFGISFFENMESALNIDSVWAQKLIEASSSINKMSDQQIIARCRQEGITIGTDISIMRKELITNLAKKSQKRQEDINYSSLKNANIDKTTDRQIVEK